MAESEPRKRWNSTFKASKSAWVRHSPFPAPKTRHRAVKSPESGTQPIRTPLKAVGKKGQEWITVRAWLKRHFKYAGIVNCEFRFRGCYFDNFLSFAHCKKRRELLEGEIYHVGLACQNCHTILDEKMSHEEMHTAVHVVIEKRGLIAPK